MAIHLNSLVSTCASRMAASGHLNRGGRLGFLLPTNYFSGQLSSLSLLSRGILNFSSSNSFSTIPSADPIKTPSSKPHHPLLSSSAPYLLIPFPKDDDHEAVGAEVKKKEHADNHHGHFPYPDYWLESARRNPPFEGVFRSWWLCQYDGNGGGGEPSSNSSRTTGAEDDTSFPEARFSDYCFYSVADQKLVSLNNTVIPDHAICVGSSHGWLAYLDPRDRALLLTNPLVSPVPSTIRLPPLETLPCTINTCFEKSWSYFVNKLVMSSAPSSDNKNDCTVMVSVGIDRRLAFCKLGDSSWTDLKCSHGVNSPTELAYSSNEKLFFCRDYFEGSKLYAWDLNNPCSPRRIDIDSPSVYGLPEYPESELKVRDGYQIGRDYLVMGSHSGDVFLVTRYSDKLPFKTLRIDVYKLNAGKRGWNYVTDLGDGVLFVGLNQAFQLSARDFPPGVLVPNSIYFTTDIDEDKDSEMGIYNMKDFTVKSLFPSHLHPINKIHQSPPIWFTPNPSNY